MDDIMEHFGFKLRKGFTDAIATQVLPQQSPRQPSPEDVAAQKIFKFLERKAGTMSEEDELEICVLVNQANLSAKNPSGDTLLNLAVWNKHDKVFMALLDKGADPLVLGINQANAFGAAILSSNHGCLDVLLKRGGVDPNMHVSYETSLAELAAEYASPALGKILSLASPQDIQFSGNALIRAARIPAPATFKTLMAYGIDMTKTDTGQGTVLHAVHAAELIPDLVRLGVNIESRRWDGMMPLAVHVENENIPCVVALLAAGANPFAKDGSGQTPRELVLNPDNLSLKQYAGQLVELLEAAEKSWIERQVERACETQKPIVGFKRLQLRNRPSK